MDLIGEGDGVFIHPHDTMISGSLRFSSELIAWISGPWALARWSAWIAALGAVVLIGLASVFSTVNDKRSVVVPTPGPVRVLIELLQYSVAAIGPWFVWSTPVSVLTTLVVILSVGAGVPRMIWLIRGAPLVKQEATLSNRERKPQQ